MCLGGGLEKAPPRKEWVGLEGGGQERQVPPEQGQQAQRIKVPNRVSAGPAQEDTMYRERLEKEAVQRREGISSQKEQLGEGRIENGIGFWRDFSWSWTGDGEVLLCLDQEQSHLTNLSYTLPRISTGDFLKGGEECTRC